MRTFILLACIAGVGLPTPALADGFGWYAYLVDYGRLESAMAGDFGAAFKAADKHGAAQELKGSAFALLGLLEESDQPLLAVPRMYDQDLLGADAIEAFAEELKKRNPSSPARFLLTGRQFLGIGNMPACRETFRVHGACGAAVFYTPEEVLALFREFNDLEAAHLKWRESWMPLELVRLRDIFQEAALLKRALFLYGHD